MSRRPLRVARVIARLNVGGPARHVLDAARGLAPEIETTLLVGDCGPGEAEATAWIESSGVVPERVPGLGRAVRPLDDLRAFRLLVRRFRELRPDVVHTHTAKAGFLGRLAARRAGIPRVVHTFHGHVFEGYFGRWTSRAIVAAERRLARRTDALVAVSEEVREDLVVRYGVAPRAKVRVVAPGIDVTRFAAARAGRGALRGELGIAPEVPVIAWVGRLVRVKDVRTAIDVADRVRASRRAEGLPLPVLLVVGDGPERAQVEPRPGVGSGVRLLGWRDDVPSVLADADLLLLTSRNEGTPVALLEAAAAGVPAVSTRVGGVPTAVEAGVTGVLAATGDVEALAAAVLDLLGDPGRRAAMGEAARLRAATLFSVERMLEDLRALYASLVPATT